MDAAKAKTGKPTRSAGKGEMTSKDKIKTMDANGDGVLGADEYTVAVKVKFTEMDANKDGAVTKAEMQAALARKDAHKATR
jgi:hypothetical protein